MRLEASIDAAHLTAFPPFTCIGKRSQVKKGARTHGGASVVGYRCVPSLAYSEQQQSNRAAVRVESRNTCSCSQMPTHPPYTRHRMQPPFCPPCRSGASLRRRRRPRHGLQRERLSISISCQPPSSMPPLPRAVLLPPFWPWLPRRKWSSSRSLTAARWSVRTCIPRPHTHSIDDDGAVGVRV